MVKQSQRPSYRTWYEKNKARLIAKQTAKRQADPEAWNAYSLAYYHRTKTSDQMTRRSEQQKIRYWKNPGQARARAKAYRRQLRDKFIAAYGGCCNCCGEQEPAFLTLEHKNKDGWKHRQRLGSSTSILRELKKLGWPKEDYELLCFNCNRATHEQGICPHRRHTE